MSGDDDDKPTVVLDLNALKREKLRQEEDLASIGQEIEFDVLKQGKIQSDRLEETDDDQNPEKSFEDDEADTPRKESEPDDGIKVVLFDFQSDFFQRHLDEFPEGHEYQVVQSLQELNKCLATRTFQIVVFNYDINPKAVNQLTAQIKLKFPHSKTLIMAKAISPEKARMHAKTASGANGYYQFPLDPSKIETELQRISQALKKAV
jgi:hypothetical protein